MQITWQGNASLVVRDRDTTLVVDPFLGRNPDRPSLTPAMVRHARAYALTHGHFDHAGDIPWLLEHRPVPVHCAPDTARALVGSHGVPADLVRPVSWRTPVNLGPLQLVPMPSRHVVFDRPLIRRTLATAFRHPRTRRTRRLPILLAEHRRWPMGTPVAWLVRASSGTAVILGSLALDPGERYPLNADALFLPLQGHSRLDLVGMAIVRALRPKRVVLHHMDDAFPPISTEEDGGPFVQAMARELPEVPVQRPAHGEPVAI